MKDEHAEQIINALTGIGAELTNIRIELQRLSHPEENPSELPSFQCRCEKTFQGEFAAKEHAKTDHGAPEGAWKDLFTRL